MKKILILLMIFTVFSSVEAENDLESLADKMIQEINFSSFSSKDEAKNFIEQYDKNIRKEFKKLSIDEKYYIFSYIRKKTGNYEDEKLDYLIKKYKKEGKFLWDMNIGDVEKDYKKTTKFSK